MSTQIKTPEEVVSEAFDAYAENLTPDEVIEFRLNAEGNWRSFIEDAIEADRAQRAAIPADVLDGARDLLKEYDALEHVDNPYELVTWLSGLLREMLEHAEGRA